MAALTVLVVMVAAATASSARAEVVDDQVIVIEADKVTARSSMCYIVVLPDGANVGDDSMQSPRRSQWRLFEDGRELGPAHSTHTEIDSLGGGRYSHWDGRLFFSASDGSNPRSNGRRYELRRVDPEAPRTLHVGRDAVLMLRTRDILDLGDTRFIGMKAPRSRVSAWEANPAPPTVSGTAMHFAIPGEYWLTTTAGPLRVLVLEDGESARAEQIVSFVMANTTGGNIDEPTMEEKWSRPRLEEYLQRRLFYADRAVDAQCWYSAMLTVSLIRHAGGEARLFMWLGNRMTDEGFPVGGHIAMEAKVAGKWVYYDPHFGVALPDRGSGLDAAVRMQREDPDSSATVFEQIVQKRMNPRKLEVSARSIRTAVRMRREDGTPHEVVLQMGADKPIIPEAIKSYELLEGPEGIERMRKMFYETDDQAGNVEGSRDEGAHAFKPWVSGCRWGSRIAA